MRAHTSRAMEPMCRVMSIAKLSDKGRRRWGQEPSRLGPSHRPRPFVGSHARRMSIRASSANDHHNNVAGMLLGSPAERISVLPLNHGRGRGRWRQGPSRQGPSHRPLPFVGEHARVRRKRVGTRSTEESMNRFVLVGIWFLECQV